MEAIGSASAAGGLISLGITICKGIIEYYSSWRGADETVKKMYQSAESLMKTFVILERAISNASLDRDAVQRVKESIDSCENALSALNNKLVKIQRHTSEGSWKERSWNRLKGAFYPFKESTLIKIKEYCNEVRDNLGLAAATLQINTSVNSLERLEILQENTSEISKIIKSLLNSNSSTLTRLDNMFSHEQNELSTKVYDWLSPLAGDFERTQQEIYNTAERQDGMAHWLFGTSDFKTWLTSTGETIWCVGMQGIGKSVLSSVLIHTLQEAIAGSNVGLAYIYHSYKNAQTQSPSNLMASVLQQLLLQRDGMSDDVLALYQRHTKSKTRPLFHEYLRLLQVTIHGFSKVYLIIDGLDECSEENSSRSNFLSGIHDLQSQTCTLFTSRNIPSIERMLHGAKKVYIEPRDQDIRNFLNQRLQKWEFLTPHLKKDPKLQETIIENILSKAQRMFLLARLYIESLTRLFTLRKIKAALTTLPEGLNSMYDDVLERIKGQDHELASLAVDVVGWVYFAARPLRLLEIQHALAVQPGDAFFDEDGLPEKDLIISVCCGILSLQEDEIVTFIHYTTKEYFDRQRSSFLKGAEEKISQICLTYLSFEDFSQGASENDKDFELRLERYPLLEYASSYWGSHVNNQETSTQAIDGLAVNFLLNAKAVSSSIQIKTVCSRQHRFTYPGYSQDFSQYTPGLVLASAFGLSRVAKELVQRGVNIEEEDSRGVRALHQAIWERRDSMTEYLLTQQANCQVQINSRNTPLHSAEAMQGSPLHLTAIKGNYRITKWLLANNCGPNARLENGWTPLHMAAANGHIHIVNLLIDHGAEVNAVDGHGGTAIYRTAENGHEEVISVLSSHGGDVNIRTKLDQTPLLRAAENGHEISVRVLLEHGADWRVKDFLGWTPLYRALDQGHDDTATLLKGWIRERRQELPNKTVSALY